MSSLHLVDPELRNLLEILPKTPFTLENLPEIRGRALPHPIDPTAQSLVNLTERTAPGPTGSPPVKVLVYEPRQRASSSLPCIFHMHGGG